MSADTWVSADVSTVLAEGFDQGARWLVLRGPASLCAYIGLPVDHPLVRASASYDDLPLDVHGGLTYSNEGDGKHHPAGWFWWGWDYAHAGDRCTYDLESGRNADEHLWTIEEVTREAKDALWQFHRLSRIAERAAGTTP
jgi:hypothetical protein